MASTYSEVKVSSSVLDYRIDWSAWLAARSTTISVADWVVTGATEGANSNTTTTATCRISAGTPATVATAKCTITTASGLIEVRSIDLAIVSALEARAVIKAPGATMAIPAPTWSDLGSDSITTYSWSAASGLTVASGGSTATVVVSGGTVNVDYALTCTITTTGGQTDARVITVQVRDR